MKIRKIIVALAAVLVPFLVFRVGSGLTEQQNVTLRDYTVSENEKTLTLHAAVFPPIEDIRDYKDEPKNGEHYLTFYNALRIRISRFILMMPTASIWFCRRMN